MVYDKQLHNTAQDMKYYIIDNDDQYCAPPFHTSFKLSCSVSIAAHFSTTSPVQRLCQNMDRKTTLEVPVPGVHHYLKTGDYDSWWPQHLPVVISCSTAPGQTCWSFIHSYQSILYLILWHCKDENETVNIGMFFFYVVQTCYDCHAHWLDNVHDV